MLEVSFVVKSLEDSFDYAYKYIQVLGHGHIVDNIQPKLLVYGDFQV